MKKLSLLATVATAAVLSACASSPAPTPMMVDNMSLPEPVRVPMGQKMKMSTTASAN